jgi:fibronectin-binding autotransporter adhesin
MRSWLRTHSIPLMFPSFPDRLLSGRKQGEKMAVRIKASFLQTANRRRRRLVVLAIAAGAVSLQRSNTARATTDTWISSSGNWTGFWTDSTHWSGGVVPGGSYLDVALTPTDGAGQTITYNYSGSAVTLNSFNLYDTVSGGYTTFNQANYALTVSGQENIAGNGTYVLSGGTDTISGSGYLSIATSNGIGSAAFNVSGAGMLTAPNIYVGGSTATSTGYTNGTLNIQSGGTVTDAGQLVIWNTSGSAVNLSTGGTLTVGSLSIGNGSAPNFQWSGGTLNITGADRFYVDSSRIGSFGSLALGTNQTLNVSAANGIAVGDGGTGLLTQTGMSAVNSYSLFIGLSGIGNYALNSSAALTVSYQEQVGSGATGIFNQSGGTHIVNGSLALGVSTGSHGVYNLNSGSLFANGEAIGYLGGLGSLVQNGGSNTVGLSSTNENLQIGSLSSNSVGTYTMNGSAATLTVNGSEYVGGYTALYGAGGTGVFNMSAGTAIVSGELCLWNTSGTTVNLTGGTLSVGSLNTSSGSASKFNWTAGTLNLSNSSLTLGSGGALGSSLTLSSGQTLNITGAGQSLNVTGTLNISGGGLNAPTINQTAGNFITAGALTLAASGGNATVYNLNGGTLTASTIAVNTGGSFNWTSGTLNITGLAGLTVDSVDPSPLGSVVNLSGNQSLNVSYGSLFVGTRGTGTFNQTGGTNAVSELCLGENSGAPGSYMLSGSGTLSAVDVIVGDGGTGTFNQTGGVITVGGLSIVGTNSSFLLSGTGVLSAADEELGNYSGSPGVFVQTGGNNTSADLGIGHLSGFGSYTLSGSGNLSDGVVAIGTAGTGIFNLAGGIQTVGAAGINDGDLEIGSGGYGTYLATRGRLTVNGYVNVGGEGGTGIFNISNAATVTITGQLAIWNTSGSVVNLPTAVNLATGGTLNVASLNTSNGLASQFNWTGGTLNITGASGFNIGSGGPLGSVVNVATGQSLGVTNTLNLSGGTLNVSGGTFSAGSIVMNASSVLGLAYGNAPVVNGNAALAGTLNLTGSVGTLPETLLTYDSYTGAFNTVNGVPANDALSYTASGLQLVVGGPQTFNWKPGTGNWSSTTSWVAGRCPAVALRLSTSTTAPLARTR